MAPPTLVDEVWYAESSRTKALEPDPDADRACCLSQRVRMAVSTQREHLCSIYMAWIFSYLSVAVSELAQCAASSDMMKWQFIQQR